MPQKRNDRATERRTDDELCQIIGTVFIKDPSMRNRGKPVAAIAPAAAVSLLHVQRLVHPYIHLDVVVMRELANMLVQRLRTDDGRR